MDFKERMRAEAEKIGLTLAPGELQKFLLYKNMLQEQNQRYSLTALTSDDDILYRHFIDSLTIVRFVNKSGAACIDIGTGAGFPLVPAGIARRDLKITLLDSVRKKTIFLEALAAHLGLENISCIHARAEDLARDPMHRGKYDYAVSRAVAPLRILVEYSVPFLKKGGIMLAMKSSPGDELDRAAGALRELKAECAGENSFEMFYGPEIYKRMVVEIVKKEETSMKYPRKAGMPEKHPL